MFNFQNFEDYVHSRHQEEAYIALAKEFEYDVLGTAPESDVADFRDDLGTLEQQRWKKLEWKIPDDEAKPCWWIVNPSEDKAQKPRLLSRSLVCLRLELYAKRCASSLKLKLEWERRLVENARGVDVLHRHQFLWKGVAGPDPDELRQPSSMTLDAAREASQCLQELIHTGGGKQDDLQKYGEQVIKAVEAIKLVAWDAIHKEKFWLTPSGLFDELVSNAETQLNRHAGEVERRRQRLAAATADEPENDENSKVLPDRVDRFGLNLDEFKNKSSRKPWKWKRCVEMASEIHLDEMRTLLELHYDDVHIAKWKHRHKIQARDSKFKVFSAVAETHRKRLTQKIVLPREIKDILQKPEDELDWNKLHELQLAIKGIVEDKQEVSLTAEEAEAVATAIEHNGSDDADKVGPGSKLPQGSRVDISVSKQGGTKSKKLKKKTADVARTRETIVVRMRPVDSNLAPPLDDVGKAMLTKHIRKFADDLALSKEQLFDKMMVVLWDALFLRQCEDWTNRKVANLRQDETLELARWFLWGQAVGDKAIFDGICSQCGTLLHGEIHKRSSLSNKCTGPPCNRDGVPLENSDGSVCTGAQPPFLLRYSPHFFAKELPGIFEHDIKTNRLSLKEGVKEPWLRPAHSRYTEKTKTWLFCKDCKERWFPEPGQKRHSYIPFRDRVSQFLSKPLRRNYKPKMESQKKPEADPEEENEEEVQFPGDMEVDGEGNEVDDTLHELPAPPEPRPTLEEYQLKWNSLLAQHSKENLGEFCRDNLVPQPNARLWQVSSRGKDGYFLLNIYFGKRHGLKGLKYNGQCLGKSKDCPHVPFDKLLSDEAQARLSVCRPISGLEVANVIGGVPTYAHNTGEVNYRRRAPLQLASTLGFVLNKQSGDFMRLTPEETDAIHECLTWGREKGNNNCLLFFGTNYETFDSACSTLMQKITALIPEACHRARIRATHRESRQPQEGQLGETLGDESRGMVVVDSSGHPLKYDALTVMDCRITKCCSI